MDTTVLFQELSAIVGDAHLKVGAASDLSLPRDWNLAAVVAPASEAEVIGIVRAAEKAGATLLPCGGRTQIETGYAPASDRSLIVVDTSRMNRVLDYQPEDMTITCEAGLTLDALQKTMTERRQFLALDVPLSGRATMGGIVSANTTGFWRPTYGAPRDLLIGMRAVMTNGDAVKGGGKVVKNVAGYDVCKLFTGAWGTLGILTEVTFRIRPVPDSQVTLAYSAPSLTAAVKAGLQIHLSRLAVTFLLATNELDGEPCLVLGLHGTPSRIEWQIAECTRIIAQEGVTAAPTQISESQLSDFRDKQARLNTSLALRAACLPTDLPATLQKLEALPGVSVTAHCMTGTLSMGASDPILSLAKLQQALPADANVVYTRLDSSVPENQSVAVWGETRADFFLHRTLKQSLDPKTTFSPGRFLGKL